MHLSKLRNWFLASPPAEFIIARLRELLIGALKQGPVPQHIAFVMDGNRRFARSHGIETVEGHNLGFEALARVSRPFSEIWLLLLKRHPVLEVRCYSSGTDSL
jgi:ditrans,polycis-polyprenyl diphosphate synthase